jgi:sulfur-oxidizing protein SoxX
MKSKFLVGSALLLAAGTAAYAGDDHPVVVAQLKADFHAKGIAGMDRLDQDQVQATCSFKHSDELPQTLVHTLQAQQLASVRYPSDGKFLGDWRKGQALAESGKGDTWKDKPGAPNGGNCYNCHQIAPSESSYGTLGPSLYAYGKRRGNTAETQKYTYAKIFNAKAFNLCTAMPRFGYAGALTEEQIKDLVALLLDPESPVNR